MNRFPPPRSLFLLLTLLAGGCAHQQVSGHRDFASLVARLSEPGGFFDTDNLISNETSYQHVIGAFDRYGVKGGAYVGVGPDQNFSYIAAIDPDIAYIIDIRRDNLLQHLLFKALFELSDSRGAYLGALFGREVPSIGGDTASIETLVGLVDAADRLPQGARDLRARVQRTVEAYGLGLSEEDRSTIDRFHRTFVDAGLDLRFVSFGRSPRPYYPTYRQLLLERDLTGEHRSYLATREGFQRVKRLQADDRVVPVVGDLGGSHALRAIGGDMAARGMGLSAFYLSNIEFYLFGDESFGRFMDNLASLPAQPDAVILRSYFGGAGWGRHPMSVPGYYMTQLMGRVDQFLESWERGELRSYGDLVVRGVLSVTGSNQPVLR